MKRVFRFAAVLLGAAAVTGTTTSCEKDEDICCDASISYDGVTVKAEACKDGSITMTYDGQTYSYNWKEDDDYEWSDWDAVKSDFEDYGGSCD